MAERQLMMVSGHIAAELSASELASDHDAQRRYLGVDA
jgi:ABC-type branched-subunit amino acid transport system ATPase component